MTDHSSYVLAPTWSGKPEHLQDQFDDRSIISSELLVAGKIWDIRRDTIDLGDGQTVVRDLMLHPGAVAVIALDDQDRVFLLRQYRHPAAALLWEPVAGLLDVAHEAPVVGAQRELVEEAGLVAGRWDVLLDFYTSPGGSSEAIRVFLARDLAPALGGRPYGDGEERNMPHTWVPLDLARDLVLAGHLSAPVAVSGVLAAWISRQSGWSTLRPADAPWLARDRLQHASRLRAQ